MKGWVEGGIQLVSEGGDNDLGRYTRDCSREA